MKRTVVYLLLGAILLVGCVTMEQVMASNRRKLLRLSPGMTKPQVLESMGTKTYAIGGDTITNPYRSEFYKTDDHTFELLFYYTDRKDADGKISDDELTPLVVLDGSLDGWGWPYWHNLASKHGLRTH